MNHAWPLTDRSCFDQILIDKLKRRAPASDPCYCAFPGYVFRWKSTNSCHGQAFPPVHGIIGIALWHVMLSGVLMLETWFRS